ncbi:MAG TPA: ubiquinone/menaquinone biosynthesis methyltransferase [Acidimicrobiia bacterium]|nr:ubiquinone/menaquinone biosynthesis methyltransferase [Acidimicrobiia bacterium]
MTGAPVSATHAPLPQGDDKHRAVETMFDRIAPRYDRLNRIISLGQDRRWRRHAVGALRLAPGATVLDLGCGTGDLCNVVAAAGYSPIGVDFSAGMLAAAHTPAPLARADALALPVPDASADAVVSGFALRNFVDLDRFFRECARVLRPGGRLAALETAEPAGPLLRAGHNLWFRRVVPFVGATLAHDAEAYDYLPRSTAYLPPPGDLLTLVEAAGFVAVERRTFTAGAVQLITGTRR